MALIREGSIEIKVPDECIARRFDGVDHGLSHCMKAVDFVIETPRALLFVELKDPDAAPAERRDEWIGRLEAGVIDDDLKTKFRDTWLYHYGKDIITKPVNFLVLIGHASLSSEALAGRTQRLKEKIPLSGPEGPWANPFLAGCAVHNLETWNRSFAQFPATRAS